MEAALAAQLQAGYGAQLAAGYCWTWSEPRPDHTLVPDVTIGDWQRPWNLKGDRALPGAPPAALWASEPAGFGQVGCVYTAQGFEYDWNGALAARSRLRLLPTAFTDARPAADECVPLGRLATIYLHPRTIRRRRADILVSCGHDGRPPRRAHSQ